MFKKIRRLIKAILQQEYAKASIYYVVANIIGQGVVLFSSAIFTRMMSKADYGLVSTYSTWVLILNTFICMNLFISVRTAYVDFRENYDNYNSSILVLNILCGIVMTIVIVTITALSGMDFGVSEVLLACVQSAALNIINYMLAIQAMKNEYKQRAIMMIAPNWTHILLSIVLMLIFVKNLYMAKIAGNAFGLLIFGIAFTIVLFRKARPQIILKYWKYALKISVPSIFSTLSDLILMQCDRLMLTSMAGADQTAEYSVIYNISSITIAIYQAINGAWLPWFFDRVKENNAQKARKYQSYYMLIFTMFSCGIMTISPELVKIMSPKNYWVGINYVAPIVVASYIIFLFTFFSAYLLYMKKAVRIAVNTIVAALLNLALNFVLIPPYKALGAVIATVASYAILFVLHLLAILKNGKEYFFVGRMWINAAAVAAYGILFFVLKDLWMARYALFGVIVILVYLIRGKAMIKEVMGEGQ